MNVNNKYTKNTELLLLFVQLRAQKCANELNSKFDKTYKIQFQSLITN
jgi:hypothetical protein